MSRSKGRLRRLFTESGSSKQLFAVMFSVLMVTSMAAPAVAASSVADSSQESLSAGSLDSAFQQVAEDDSGPAYDEANVSVWDRSPLPLRVETATAATQLDNPTLLYSVSGEVSQANLNKPTTGVFNAGENISFDFSQRTLATTSNYNGQSAQFVTARIEESPDNVSDAIDIATLQSPTAEEYTVEDVGTIQSGSLDINRSFDQSGHYLTYVVVVQQGEGLSTTAEGDLTLNGSVEVVGADAVAVQSNGATVSAPAEVQRGENITVDVSDSGLTAGAQNHLLIAYNETKFTEQEVTFISDTDNFDNLTEDNITINHTLDRVNGVGNFDADVSVLGLSANSTTRIDGVVSTDSIFAELTNQTSIDQLQNNSVGDNVLDASATSTATLDSGSISVETLPGWETGEYRLIYVAQEDGAVSNFTTTTDTVTLSDEELVADLTAEPTNPDVGVTPVRFDASSTQGSVATYYWDFDGDGTVDAETSDPTINHTYTAELGEYTASVTTQNGDGENSTATATVSVGDTVPPTAALDITLDGTSLVGGEIGIDTRFTVNASGSTDNHRLGTPYSWEITNSSGVVETRETLEDTTSFRLSQTGNYTVNVTVVDESGNENSTTEAIEVVDESILDAEIDAADRQRLQDGLNATVNVTNVGSSDSESGYSYTLTATGTRFDGGEVTRTITGSQSSLNVSETDPITFDNELTAWAQAQQNRTVGDVDLTFKVSADGRVSNDSTTVDVTYSNLEADAAVRDTVEGVNVDLRSFIENNGTAASDDSTATVTVENSGDTEVYNETITVSSLDPGETLRDRNTTSFGTADTYTLNVTAEDDLFAEGNSISTEFEVYGYSLSIQETAVPSQVESGNDFIARLTYQANATAPVNATLNVSETTGIEHVPSGQTDTKQRSPTAGLNDTVTWRLNATEYVAGGYALNFTVDSASDGLDASSSQVVTISSERRSETRTNENAVIVADGVSDSVQTSLSVYDNSSFEHSLNVTVQGGAEGRTLSGLEYLVNYPYGCVEQTTSAFLGALNTEQYYRANGDYQENVSDSRKDRINKSVAQGVEALNQTGSRAQLTDGANDGSWNMWGLSGADGETFFTMYALYGLSEVENDQNQSALNSNGLDDVDFDAAVTWMKGDQTDDGSFDADYYIDDDAAATGFAMVSLAEANKTYDARITSQTTDNITDIYANGAEYLVDEQESSGGWTNDQGNEHAKSTALAVWGLQIALEADAYEKSSELTQSDMQTAIDDGVAWLEDNQDNNAGWKAYHQNSWWNSVGDKSETTAYGVLALDAANQASSTSAIDNATDYLTETYETRGSWGYPRATAISIEALLQTTESTADRTVNVTFTTDGASASENVTISDIEVNGSTSEVTRELTDTQEQNVRDLINTDGAADVDVIIEDTGASAQSGRLIVGLESAHEVDLDILEGDQ